jgi:hypothetical protein
MKVGDVLVEVDVKKVTTYVVEKVENNRAWFYTVIMYDHGVTTGPRLKTERSFDYIPSFKEEHPDIRKVQEKEKHSFFIKLFEDGY